MSACPDNVLALQGLVDGELDAANALAVENHLKTCEACHVEYQRLLSLRDALAGAGSLRAPARLRANIEAALAVEAAPSPAARPAPRRKAPWIAGGGLAAIAAAAGFLLVAPQLAERGVEQQLVASHVRSLLANHLTDIVTSDQHVVRPWFNGKVDVAPPAPELRDLGFPLVGGRLDYVDGRVTPAIVYRRRLHVVNLFAQPLEGRGGPDRSARRDGYSLVEWSQDGLRFFAVSDVELGELKQFQAAFRSRSPQE